MKNFQQKKWLGITLALVLSTSASQTFGNAFVHLFEWQWSDIASECENHLGPKGYSAVQVSPPQKSIDNGAWWARYQPVSYAIEGRSGDRAAFQDMASRCGAVGVDVYVDTVINHMAAWDRNFPEVPFGPNDFHNCTSDINYGNRWEVQNCDLVGLNDLKTESDYVRGKIADYMNDLISLGVDGFRIDASKHMPAGDIDNIKSRLNGNPYIYQEVIGASGEPVQPGEYTFVGDVTEFQFTDTIGHYFKQRGALADLRNIGTWAGWLNSADAVTFVANHDNQRQNTGNTITHKDGNNVNDIAHVFTLAWPYGYPKVMSSYDWSDHDQGPPGHGASACNGGWLCEHRNRAIANMVGFRNATSAAFSYSNWWDNGGNQIAFSRGSLGFVAINGESSGTLSRILQTGMPDGTYCDIVNGDFIDGLCTGNIISVDSNGNAFFSVGAKQASAIHVNALVGGNPPPDGECSYSSMFLRGTFNDWGTDPMTCSDGRWTATVTFSGGSDNRFKFDAFGDWGTDWGDNNDDGFADQGGDDISLASAGTYTITLDDSSLAYSVTSDDIPPPPPSGGTVTVSFTCNNGVTYSGQSVYAVGSISELGSWSAANAVKLDPTGYPTWTGDIQIPEDTSVEWKCLKRDENNSAAGVEWQGGDNNVFNSGSTGANTTGAF